MKTTAGDMSIFRSLMDTPLLESRFTPLPGIKQASVLLVSFDFCFIAGGNYNTTEDIYNGWQNGRRQVEDFSKNQKIRIQYLNFKIVFS
jgi:hypothetical protein